jgi:plastocyanin
LADTTGLVDFRLIPRLCALGVLWIAVFTGPAVQAGSASTARAEVHVSNFTFDPPTLAVPVGGTLTWIHRDDERPTVTAAGGAFPPSTPTRRSPFRFDAPGTYVYHCAIHSRMTVAIVVQ